MVRTLRAFVCQSSENRMQLQSIAPSICRTKLSSHNHQLLSECYDQYANSLFGIILRVTSDQALGEHILHQAFLTIAKSDTFFEPINQFRRFALMSAVVVKQCALVLSVSHNFVIQKMFSVGMPGGSHV